MNINYPPNSRHTEFKPFDFGPPDPFALAPEIVASYKIESAKDLEGALPSAQKVIRKFFMRLYQNIREVDEESKRIIESFNSRAERKGCKGQLNSLPSWKLLVSYSKGECWKLESYANRTGRRSASVEQFWREKGVRLASERSTFVASPMDFLPQKRRFDSIPDYYTSPPPPLSVYVHPVTTKRIDTRQKSERSITFHPAPTLDIPRRSNIEIFDRVSKLGYKLKGVLRNLEKICKHEVNGDFQSQDLAKEEIVKIKGGIMEWAPVQYDYIMDRLSKHHSYRMLVHKYINAKIF